MELQTFDRLILLNVLPKEGNVADIRIIHGLKQRLSFSEEEQAALELTLDEDHKTYRWRNDADQPVEIEIGTRATEIIRATLKELSNEGKLTEAHLGVCEKFDIE